MEARTDTRLSVVIVTHNHAAEMPRTLVALLPELGGGDQLIVVDNASIDSTVDVVRENAPDAVVVDGGGNTGFAAGCNRGAAEASGGLFVFLNPDAVPEPGFGQAIRRPLAEQPDWDAWMGLVTMEGGALVNTAGGVVHFSGISWAGRIGEPADAVAGAPAEVGFVSGACLAVPREVWQREGGFPEHFFMYCEDLDLSLRVRLAGGRIGIEPRARVDHDYEFMRRPEKWRMLERNRWSTIIRTYPAGLLLLLAPALAASELAVLVAAVAGGWGRQKLWATLDTLRALPVLLRERRAIQGRAQIGAGEFASGLTSELSSPYIGAGRLPGVQPLLDLYWRAVRAILR